MLRRKTKPCRGPSLRAPIAPRAGRGVRISPARGRIVCPIDCPRCNKAPLQLLLVEIEDIGKRAEPCFDQFMLVAMRQGFRFRTAKPAREYGQDARTAH